MNDAGERFVERGTQYDLQGGTLWIYETNIACRNVKFKFNSYVLTLMVLGHKNIRSPQLNYEFFPGTLFIPECNTEMAVTIPNATPTNPTKCLVLEIDPEFIYGLSQEIGGKLPENPFLPAPSDPMTHFFSNDQRTIECFTRLYDLRKEVRSDYDQLIVTLTMKELLLRVFHTPGGDLLMKNTQQRGVHSGLEMVTQYITKHLGQHISIDELARIAGISKTSLFNKFKAMTGLTPVQYITRERIEYAKLLLGQYGYIKETAFKCGFNSYEHFCKSFKRLEGISPREFKAALVG